MSIGIQKVTKRFGSYLAVDNVSIDVPGGSLLALLGPSGSGKTTLLRIIAGLEVPDSGTVLYQDEDATRRSARDRNFGFVFQHYALFRHLSVFENIAFGLRVRKWPQVRVRDRVHELLHLIQLAGLENRYPAQLSGGQRQRVALARALAPEPRVLLLDEPFGALDAKVRQELRLWLRRLHDQIAVTSIFVTHDQEEAFEVADQVAIMRAGRVEQMGTPLEVFEHPASAFVMSFLGNVNRFDGQVRNGKAVLGRLEIPVPPEVSSPAGPATLFIRPHEMELSRSPNGVPSFEAEIIHIVPAGSVAKVHLRTAAAGDPVNVELSPSRYAELALKPGDRVHVFPRRVRAFAADQSH